MSTSSSTSSSPARRCFGTRVAPHLLERLEDVRYRESKASHRKVTLTALVEEALVDFLAKHEAAHD